MQVYLDNAATTRIDPRVIEVMNHAEMEFFHNPAATYAPAITARREIERATNVILSRLSRNSTGQLIFTSGATESNNLVIFGKITSVKHRLLVMAGEHPSSYSPSAYLKQNDYHVDYFKDLRELEKLLLIAPPQAVVFSLVNSETGTINPVREIVQLVKKVAPRAHVHLDAVQGFCKFDFCLDDFGIDSASISAHKIHGPKGIGALWLKNGVTLQPIMFGGSAHGFRPGTDNTPAILGFARAVEIFETKKNHEHVAKLYDYLIQNLPTGVALTARNDNPYITGLLMPEGILGSHVQNALSAKGIYVGLGSACSSKATKNRALLAIGLSDSETKRAIRISFSHENSIDDVENFVKVLDNTIKSL